ncbi:hypothetical protein ACFL6F_03910, partial [Planctomycetota bacterium]
AKIIFLVCVFLASFVFIFFVIEDTAYCQEDREEEVEVEEEEEDEDDEEEDLFDRTVSVGFKKVDAAEAVRKLSAATGINIILQAGLAQDYANKGITVTFALKNTSSYDTIQTFAEYLNLSCSFRDRIALLKRKPKVDPERIVGTLVIKDDRFTLTMNIYDGEISPELKKRLVNEAIEQRLMLQEAKRERIEHELERQEAARDLEEFIQEKVGRHREKRGKHRGEGEEEKGAPEKPVQAKEKDIF